MAERVNLLFVRRVAAVPANRPGIIIRSDDKADRKPVEPDRERTHTYEIVGGDY